MLWHRPKLILRVSVIIVSAFLGVIFFAVKGQSAGVKPVATPSEQSPLAHTLIPSPNTTPSPLHRYPQIGGDFTLTNTEGQLQSFNSLKESLVLLTFGFTACTHTCPMILAKLSRLRHELSVDDQKKVRIVFINVDPKVSVADLKKYISFFEPKDATDLGIIGFTGTHDDLQKVAKQYGATFFESPKTGFESPKTGFESPKTGFENTQTSKPTQKTDAITHTDRIFLIDTTQTIRKIYSKEVIAKEVIEDIQTLMHTRIDDAQ